MKTKSIIVASLASVLVLGVALAANAANAAPPAATATQVKSEERKFQRIADVKRGEPVVLRGEVTRILDEDEFLLADDTGRIRIYIGWKNDLPVKTGDTVIVEGRADDDTIFGMRPEIYARVLELADGERVTLIR
jgi:uncharacterized protein YdeI (BOF family)